MANIGKLLWFILVVLISNAPFLASTETEETAEIESREADREKFTSKQCFCHLADVRSGAVVYDYGEIETYQWPDTYCHDAHVQCRMACRDKLNLEVPDEKGSPSRGFMYCKSYGRETGASPLRLRAVWRLDHCRRAAEQQSARTTDLCCRYHVSPPGRGEGGGGGGGVRGGGGRGGGRGLTHDRQCSGAELRQHVKRNIIQ